MEAIERKTSGRSLRHHMYQRFDKAKTKPISVGSACFYCAFICCALVTFLGMTQFEEVLGISVRSIKVFLTGISIYLLFFKMLLERPRPGRWFLLIFLIIVAFLSWRESGEIWLFWALVFIACGNGIDIKKLALTVLVTSLLTLVITCTSALSGRIPNLIFTRDDGTIRLAMGFNHPNTFAMFVLLPCMAIVTLRFGKNSIPSMLALFLGAYVCYLVANSRSTAILALAQAAFLPIFQSVRSKKARKIASGIMIVVIFVIAALSLYMMVAYDSSNPVHAALNEATNTRFYWAHEQYKLAPLSLFGNDYLDTAPFFYRNGEPYHFYVDNAYAHLVLRYGLIPSACFLTGYFVLIRRLMKRNEWNYLLFGLFILAVYGLTETYALQITCNYYLVALAPILYGTQDRQAIKR